MDLLEILAGLRHERAELEKAIRSIEQLALSGQDRTGAQLSAISAETAMHLTRPVTGKRKKPPATPPEPKTEQD